MKHHGKILEIAVRKSKIPITSIADAVGYSGRHMYNLFETEELPMELFMKVGKIIGHDFSFELPDLSTYNIMREPEGVYETNNIYKQKYLELMEKHIRLIEDMEKMKEEFENSAPIETTAPKVRQKSKAK